MPKGRCNACGNNLRSKECRAVCGPKVPLVTPMQPGTDFTTNTGTGVR